MLMQHTSENPRKSMKLNCSMDESMLPGQGRSNIIDMRLTPSARPVCTRLAAALPCSHMELIVALCCCLMKAAFATNLVLALFPHNMLLHTPALAPLLLPCLHAVACCQLSSSKQPTAQAAETETAEAGASPSSSSRREPAAAAAAGGAAGAPTKAVPAQPAT